MPGVVDIGGEVGEERFEIVVGVGGSLPDVTIDADLKKLCRTVVVAPRSDQPQRLLVHIRDSHFVSREAYATDLRDQNPDVTEEEIDEAFAESVVTSQAVQQEQAAVLRHLIRRYGTKQVFLEGLTDRDAKVFDIIVNSLRRTKC